jgi:tagaturonate reductase
VRRREKITCISGSVNAYEDFDGYLREAALPSLKVVVSNTTEAGIAYVETDKADDRPASSYPGKLTQFLRAPEFLQAKSRGGRTHRNS